MRLTLRQLNLFHAVAATGTTTSAGHSVALSQSAVSSAVGELEDVLGAKLFDRIGKRLVLNDNGRMLLPMTRALLTSADEIEQSCRAGKVAPIHLKLAASTTIGNYLMPTLLARFQQQWPNARLELHIGNTQEVVSLTSSMAVDLGLIEGPCRDTELKVIPWLEDELAIVSAPNHPLLRQASKRRLSAKQLQQARWLLRETGSGTREEVEQALLPHLGHFSDVMTLGSSEAIKYSVAEGIGISCLSLYVVNDLIRTKKLAVVPTTLPPLRRRYSLAHHHRKRLSDPLKAFAAHCAISLQIAD